MVAKRFAGHRGTPHLEALLPVLVLLEEVGIVDDDLSVGNLELKDAVVHRLGRLDGPDRFLEVDVEGPELERLEQALLDRQGLCEQKSWYKLLRAQEGRAKTERQRSISTHLVVERNVLPLVRDSRCALHDFDRFVVVPVENSSC